MLLTPASAPPTGAGYIHELKFDRYRAFVRVAGGRVRVTSRHGTDLTDRYPELASIASAVTGDALLDGELVVFGTDGRPRFYDLSARYPRSRTVPFCPVMSSGCQ